MSLATAFSWPGSLPDTTPPGISLRAASAASLRSSSAIASLDSSAIVMAASGLAFCSRVSHWRAVLTSPWSIIFSTSIAMYAGGTFGAAVTAISSLRHSFHRPTFSCSWASMIRWPIASGCVRASSSSTVMARFQLAGSGRLLSSLTCSSESSIDVSPLSSTLSLRRSIAFCISRKLPRSAISSAESRRAHDFVARAAFDSSCASRITCSDSRAGASRPQRTRNDASARWVSRSLPAICTASRNDASASSSLPSISRPCARASCFCGSSIRAVAFSSVRSAPCFLPEATWWANRASQTSDRSGAASAARVRTSPARSSLPDRSSSCPSQSRSSGLVESAFTLRSASAIASSTLPARSSISAVSRSDPCSPSSPSVAMACWASSRRFTEYRRATSRRVTAGLAEPRLTAFLRRSIAAGMSPRMVSISANSVWIWLQPGRSFSASMIRFRASSSDRFSSAVRAASESPACCRFFCDERTSKIRSPASATRERADDGPATFATAAAASLAFSRSP